MINKTKYPYDLPLDEDHCRVCGKKTIFDEEWTPEDAVEDYEVQSMLAKLNQQISGKKPDPNDNGKAYTACGDCYNMLHHIIAPTKVFLKGMMKLGFVDKKYYRELKKKYGL